MSNGSAAGDVEKGKPNKSAAGTTSRKAIGGVAGGEVYSLPGASMAQPVSWMMPGGGLGGSSWFPAAGPMVVDAKARAREMVGMGDSLCGQGRFGEAVQPYGEAVRLQPGEADYHLRLGIAAWQSGMMELGEQHMQEAVRLTPGNARAHEAISQYWGEAGNMELALYHSAKALELEPEGKEVAISRASVLEANGEAGAAWQVLAPLVGSGMKSGRLGIVYGRIAGKIKRERDALELIERVLDEVERVPQQRAKLHFTAASLWDRLGEWDKAFEQARLAQEISRRPYDPKSQTEWIERQIDYFTPWKLHDLPRASHGNRRPVFIVGMMRSGTSLVEQILASHPQVHGGGELGALRQIALAAEQGPWAEGAAYPEYLETLSVRSANKLAKMYLSVLSLLNEKTTYVTDKMPHNFLYLGLIVTLFPDCHVIHCVRDPLDTCLSCYMTQFLSHRHEFTRDLGHLGAFYRDYDRLMKHWKTKLNFPMFEMRYEELVNDVEGQTRRLLEYLDLPWDAECLRFYENKRHVATASYDQVRRPIYGSSVGRWKHYEKHLGPLMTVLRESGIIERAE